MSTMGATIGVATESVVRTECTLAESSRSVARGRALVVRAVRVVRSAEAAAAESAERTVADGDDLNRRAFVVGSLAHDDGLAGRDVGRRTRRGLGDVRVRLKGHRLGLTLR